jgi:hypothetical protein
MSRREIHRKCSLKRVLPHTCSYYLHAVNSAIEIGQVRGATGGVRIRLGGNETKLLPCPYCDTKTVKVVEKSWSIA